MLYEVLAVGFKVLINVFIVSTLFWMIFWDSDVRNPIRTHWIPKIQRVFMWLGLDAQWRMFSPDPPQRTIWPMAKLTMKNNDVISWEPSPYAKNTVLQNLRYKKFNKYFHEVIRPRSGHHIKRDFVEYLLQKPLHEEPCVKVEVYLVAQPAKRFHRQSAEKTPPIYKQLVYTFYPAEIESPNP
jgi:hypothetical protein